LNGTLTVAKENVALTYTGDSLVSTGSTSTSSTTTVKMAASVVEQADGNLGSQLGATKIKFTLYKANDTSMLSSPLTCTATVVVPATYNGTGTPLARSVARLPTTTW
jgi:hypothetical protein